MNTVQALKNLAMDRQDVDELMSLKAHAIIMVAQYGAFQVETPQWLVDANASLDREIKARHRDQLERALKDAEREIDGLKTPAERRTEAQARAAKLREQLGK